MVEEWDVQQAGLQGVGRLICDLRRSCRTCLLKFFILKRAMKKMGVDSPPSPPPSKKKRRAPTYKKNKNKTGKGYERERTNLVPRSHSVLRLYEITLDLTQAG